MVDVSFSYCYKNTVSYYNCKQVFLIHLKISGWWLAHLGYIQWVIYCSHWRSLPVLIVSVGPKLVLCYIHFGLALFYFLNFSSGIRRPAWDFLLKSDENLKESKTSYASSFPCFVCFMSANIPKARANNLAKLTKEGLRLQSNLP